MDNAPQDIAPIQNFSLFKLYFKNTNVEDVKNEIHTTGNVCVLNALRVVVLFLLDEHNISSKCYSQLNFIRYKRCVCIKISF